MYFAGIKLVDIAKELKVPEGTIRSWKNRYKWDCNVAKTERNAAKNAKRVKKVVAEEVENVTQNTKLTDKQQLFAFIIYAVLMQQRHIRKLMGVIIIQLCRMVVDC